MCPKLREIILVMEQFRSTSYRWGIRNECCWKENKKTPHKSLSGNKSHTDSVCFFHLFNVTYYLMFIDVSQCPPPVPKWTHRTLQEVTVPIGSWLNTWRGACTSLSMQKSDSRAAKVAIPALSISAYTAKKLKPEGERKRTVGGTNPCPIC